MAPGREYGGQSAHERVAARRARLIAAGRELFATRGVAATTVKVVCDTAGLTQRYFYESFRTVEALALAVVEDLAEQTATAVLSTTATDDQPDRRAEAAFGALVDRIAADPDAGRIMLIETSGNGAQLAAWRRRLMTYGAQVLEDWATEDHPEAPDEATALVRRISSLAMAGGIIEVLVAWLEGRVQATPAQLTSALTQTAAAGRRHV
jgi:AcrR family transcriptional regulator